ncbi:MAG: DUF2207 domain-containing protein [Methanospirillaceae archaeon]|nr:DUF2207 domain-containing protein [Methanospirillaceae archaeon]
MREEKQIALLFLITLIMGLLGSAAVLVFPSLIEPDLAVSRYEAAYTWDGTLSEEYRYRVRDGGVYRSLNRKFSDPLLMERKDTPCIVFESMSVPDGCLAYVKDSYNRVFLPGDENAVLPDAIQSNAAPGEMGAYNPSYYDPGDYVVEYRVRMYPPIEYDDSYAHLNLKLAEEHIPYTDLKITIPSEYVKEIFPHPDTLSVEKTDGTYRISGSVREDENLGIELLLSPDIIDTIPGFPRYTGDVEAQTREANRIGDSLAAGIVSGIHTIALLFVILVPFLLLGIWFRSGRERSFEVPDSISFIPDPALQPWMVNLIFKGDAVSFDKDGLYATLLSLHRKKKIRIMPDEEKNVKITVLDETSEDAYEKEVLDVLVTISEDNVVDTKRLSALTDLADNDSDIQKTVLRYQKLISSLHTYTDTKLIDTYITNGRGHIYPFLGAGIAGVVISFICIFLFPVYFGELLAALILFIITAIQAAVALVFPATLFGRWNKDYYREKLQWDGFSAFLSDFAAMKKYAFEDLAMWGDWLIYGTALGVGENVVKAMDKLNIHLPYLDDSPALYHTALLSAFVPVTAYSVPSSGGSGGGSFGGGGGFGGGGAGGW